MPNTSGPDRVELQCRWVETNDRIHRLACKWILKKSHSRPYSVVSSL